MIARKMYSSADSPLQSVLKFLDHSEKYMEFSHDHKQKPGQLPPLRKVDRKIEELRTMQSGSNRMSTRNSLFIDFRTIPVKMSRKPARRKPRKALLTTSMSEEDSPESQ